MDPGNCFIVVHIVNCDDNNEGDYVTDGYWVMGKGGVSTVDPAGDKWPHQVAAWEFDNGEDWQSDPRLTLTEELD